MDKLADAVRLANKDWRDLLVAAGFAESVDAHKDWKYDFAMASVHVDFFTALLGGILQEVVFWYGARTKLSANLYKKLLVSIGYWCITTAMIVLSALGAVVWFQDSPKTDARTYLLAGAAFPVFFKKFVDAFTSHTSTLGSPDHERFSALKGYFRAS
jgi:hypothetical protein